MTYYDYNGVNYDIDTDDPAAAKAKIQAHLGERPGIGQQLKNEVASVNTAGDVGTVLSKGIVGNTLGAPVDLVNMGLQGADYVANKLTGAVRPEALPYLPKLASDNPVGGGQWFNKQMADAGIVGQQQRPLLEAGAGLLPIAPSAVKGAYNVAREIPGAVKAIPGAIAESSAGQFGSGVAKGAFVNRPGTSTVKVGDTYLDPEGVKLFEQGKIDKATLDANYSRNTAELPWQTRTALKVAGNEVPATGMLGQGLGEGLAKQVTDPLKLGLNVLTGGIYGGVTKPAQLAAQAYLNRKMPLSPTFLEKYKNNPDIPPPAANAPVAGPVMPPVGEQLPLPLSSNIVPPPGQFNLQPPPGEMPKTIQQQVQDVAASKIIGMPKQDPATTAVANNPQAQAILAQIRARGTNQPAPAATTPVAPVEPAPFVPPANWTNNPGYRAPVGTPTAPTEAPVIQQANDTLAKLKANLPTPTPEQLAAQEAKVAAHNALTPAEKAAKTRSENKASDNITFNDLANDIEGAKEFNITHDIKNKTRTELNPSGRDITSAMDSEQIKALPKKVEWEKSVEHWTPDGSAIAFEEHYTKATKNTPAYKFRENIESDEPNMLYKKEAGGDWQIVNTPDPVNLTTNKTVTMGQGREKPLGPNVAKKAIAEATAAGKTYDITYKLKGNTVREINKRIKFTPDPSVEITHTTMHTTVSGDNSVIAKGTRNGKPITIRVDKDGKYTIE